MKLKLVLTVFVGVTILINNIIEEKYENLSSVEKEELHTLFKSKETRKELQDKISKILFKIQPPTPEEFLDSTNGWLSKKICDSVFPHIKKEFIEILGGDKDGDNYNKIVQYGATRLGKSFLARLLIIYTIIFIHCCRDAPRMYSLSPLTELCIYII